MTGSGKAVSSESGTLHTQSDGMFESVSVGTAEAGASKFECELKRKKKKTVRFNVRKHNTSS